LALVAGDQFPSIDNGGPMLARAVTSQNLPPLATCNDGLALDVHAGTGALRIRVLGVVSASRSPELWQDDEMPTLDGRWPKVAHQTADFWLGVFAD
jgi:hypothetical protein